MMSEQEIIREIEESVDKMGRGRYKMWIIGVTDDPSKEDPSKPIKVWQAENTESAQNIFNQFVAKGMCPSSGKHSGPYVFIY